MYEGLLCSLFLPPLCTQRLKTLVSSYEPSPHAPPLTPSPAHTSTFGSPARAYSHHASTPSLPAHGHHFYPCTNTRPPCLFRPHYSCPMSSAHVTPHRLPNLPSSVLGPHYPPLLSQRTSPRSLSSPKLLNKSFLSYTFSLLMSLNTRKLAFIFRQCRSKKSSCRRAGRWTGERKRMGWELKFVSR